MTLPEPLEVALDDEEITARVALGGDDEIVVTDTRTLQYEADGILSEEAVETFPHDTTRLSLSPGRRKCQFTLTYPVEGERSFTVPSSHTEDVLHTVLAGILGSKDVIQPGETVHETYRFSELTIVLTSNRLIKHVGEAVWDEDFEVYPFEQITDLVVEDGDISSQLVLTFDGRHERLKVPREAADALSHQLKRAIRGYHDVDRLDELGDREATHEDRSDPAAAFESDVAPLSTSDEDPSGAEDTRQEPPNEEDSASSSLDDETVRLELEKLATRIASQQELLAEQQEVIERLRDRLD